MNIVTILNQKLHEEQEHSAFLEKLLKALYGKGWSRLTIFEANKWREQNERK